MKSELRCSAAARAACEFRETCGEEATFFEGSECHQFNEEIERKARLKTKQVTKQATSDKECKYCLDEFCVNDQCPMCADYCPVAAYPDVCRYEER